MAKIFLRTPHNYDRKKASDSNGLKCADATRTQQHFKEECDINTLVRRFGLTGEFPQNLRTPINPEFAQVTDFHGAMTLIAEARQAFGQMPAETRYRFHNDPAEFVDFCSNPENRAEMRKMGLLVPEEAPPASPPAVAAPAPTGTVAQPGAPAPN